MSGFYEQLCNLFIRPARQTYNDFDLGSPIIANSGCRQNFSFTSAQGLQLKASFFKHKQNQNNTCVIYLHSFNGSRLESLRYVPDLLIRGFHFCSFDFAGCGNSPGEYVSLGYNERQDVLKLVEHLHSKYNVTQFFLWGRSMGAVAAIKFHSLLTAKQLLGKYSEYKILGLILDSAFISLKRLVIEVGRSRVNIPEFLIRALFLMISSSIQERAKFKVEELELEQDIDTIRCSTILITSKEDTFVNFNHSEQIFTHLKLHSSKQIEYTRGQHYEHREQKVVDTVYNFIHKRYQEYAETERKNKLTQLRQPNFGKYGQNNSFSMERHANSLKKYKSRAQIEANRGPEAPRGQSATKIIFFRPTLSEKSPKHHISTQYKTIESQKKIPLQSYPSTFHRPYLTEKKLEGSSDPKIKIVVGTREFKQKNELLNKNKPSFINKITTLPIRDKPQEIIKEIEVERKLNFSNEKTQEYEPRQQQNHCNVISSKLKKRGKAHKQKMNDVKITAKSEIPQQTSVHEHINHTHPERNETTAKLVGNLSYTCINTTHLEERTKEQISRNESYKKLSMTVLQYKNSQISTIKGIIKLSPKKRQTNNTGTLKMKLDGREQKQQPRIHEQSKSMNNLHFNMGMLKNSSTRLMAQLNGCCSNTSLPHLSPE